MLAVKVAGEYFDKKVRITYNGQVIHDGYIEGLVTSLDGELELEFNYGSQQVSSVIVKQFTNKIIFSQLNSKRSMPIISMCRYVLQLENLASYGK